MQDSIFTKIIKGEIPSHKIYEDEYVLAFLDIHPASPGHTLVVPKKQVEFVWDLENDDYQHLMTAVQKVAHHLREHSGKKYVGEIVVGVDVPHAHVHLVPFDSSVELQGAFHPIDTEPDHTALAALAEKLRFS